MMNRTKDRTPLFIAAGVLAGFLIGFLWQYTAARGYSGELDSLRQEQLWLDLEATLGAASIEAHRGGHEAARQLASRFFTELQQNIGSAPAAARATFDDILARRDAMITSLSRNDPQSGPLLGQLFIRYRSAMGRQVGPDAGTMPAPAAADTQPGA
jgi:hypothetical protein